MKTQMILLSLICMTVLYGCGGDNKTSTTLSGTSPIGSSSIEAVTVNGIKSTPAPAQFIGTWTGYLDDSYTAITIAPNGSITITAVGSPTRSRLLVLSGTSYYIVNTDSQTGVLVKSNGAVLTVTVAGVNETLSKN